MNSDATIPAFGVEGAPQADEDIALLKTQPAKISIPTRWFFGRSIIIKSFLIKQSSKPIGIGAIAFEISGPLPRYAGGKGTRGNNSHATVTGETDFTSTCSFRDSSASVRLPMIAFICTRVSVN